MKKLLATSIVIFLFLLFTPTTVRASSMQAYQDFQYQFDQYRQKLTDFGVAFNEYKQFNSLASQQDTIDKAKLLLAQRNTAAKSYYLYLNEKLNEDPGVGAAEAAGIRTNVTNGIAFLEQNSQAIAGINSLDDVTSVSKLFVKNYFSMQAAYRTSIIDLEVGYLNFFVGKFDAIAAQSQLFINASRGLVTPEKQAVLDRWLLQLSNIHSTYAQNVKAINAAKQKITGDVLEQDRQFASAQKLVDTGRQNLILGASFLTELTTALQYE